jgi:peptidase E
MEPQIVAIGGGGFSDGSENLALENFIVGLSNRPRPKVCFVPTASGDSEQYLLKFYASFAKLPATATHLPLFRLAVRDLRSYLLGQDVIYVGGISPGKQLSALRRRAVTATVLSPFHFRRNDDWRVRSRRLGWFTFCRFEIESGS